MTTLADNHTMAAPAFRRSALVLLIRFRRTVNRWVAAMIARHEREAALFVRRRLTNRKAARRALQRRGQCFHVHFV